MENTTGYVSIRSGQRLHGCNYTGDDGCSDPYHHHHHHQHILLQGRRRWSLRLLAPNATTKTGSPDQAALGYSKCI